jgi:DNA-binding helix-hairpin-helix protein with protein kinase domain
MHPNETARIQTRFEVTRRRANQVRGRADMQGKVVALRLDPVDVL